MSDDHVERADFGEARNLLHITYKDGSYQNIPFNDLSEVGSEGRKLEHAKFKSATFYSVRRTSFNPGEINPSLGVPVLSFESGFFARYQNYSNPLRGLLKGKDYYKPEAQNPTEPASTPAALKPTAKPITTNSLPVHSSPKTYFLPVYDGENLHFGENTTYPVTEFTLVSRITDHSGWTRIPQPAQGTTLLP